MPSSLKTTKCSGAGREKIPSGHLTRRDFSSHDLAWLLLKALCRAAAQQCSEDEQHRNSETDGVRSHYGAEGPALRENEGYPRNADAADAEYGQHGGGQRSAEGF